MRRSNGKIKQWLVDNGYKDIHLFPHTRFCKDVTIDQIDFDGIAAKGTNLVLFQCKTNNKPSKKLMIVYKEMSEKYEIECLYLVNFDRKGVICYK